MQADPGAELADIFAAIDPDTIFRSIALYLAESRCSRDKTHTEVMAVAAAFYEFMDPWTDENEPDKITFKLDRP